MNIPFVQGKFNAGSTGSFQFCGNHNVQLIISRRNPAAPIDEHDETGELWGFTVVRRRRPRGPNERSSVFKYLTPGGKVPAFESDSMPLLPGKSSKDNPGIPYSVDVDYGSCVKLYNYRWPGISTATLEAKREIERYFQVPCLPFRIHETRQYKANYFSTTVSGIWNNISDEQGANKNHEEGFPADIDFTVEGLGRFPAKVVVWKEKVRTKDVPTGVFFLVNGQVHGQYTKDFISRSLDFDYIRDHLLVAVDLTNMDRSVGEDLIMGSRDRLRKLEPYYSRLREKTKAALRDHPGLKEINAEWRRRRKEKALESKEDVTKVFDLLLKNDPSLASVLNMGGPIPSGTGPGIPQAFKGERFPTYFRLAKEPKKGLTKHCPVNATVKVEFETDAENLYFSRADERGTLKVVPSLDLIESSRLWNGRFNTKFRVSWNASPGDEFVVKLSVTDDSRLTSFECEFKLVADDPIVAKPKRPGDPNPPVTPVTPKPKINTPQLQIPEPQEVRKQDWERYGFHAKYGDVQAIRIKHSEEEGYDFFINVDNKYLLNEINNKRNDPDLVKAWFIWGVTILTLGTILSEQETLAREGRSEDKPDLESIAAHCVGIGRVIIPLIRSMSELELAKLE